MTEQSRVVVSDDEMGVSLEDGQVIRCRPEAGQPDREGHWIACSPDETVGLAPPSWWESATKADLRRFVDQRSVDQWRLVDAAAGR